MVCDRCILVVKQEIDKLNLHASRVELGIVHWDEHALPSPIELQNLEYALERLGFAFIKDKKTQLVEQIKTLIQGFIRNDNPQRTKQNLSDYLADSLNQDYQQLASLFSAQEGTTIEKYFIAQRIEYVKELLTYGELTLREIAYQLDYSSTAYLSNQFKKITGQTPTEFKTRIRMTSGDRGPITRQPLDRVYAHHD